MALPHSCVLILLIAAWNCGRIACAPPNFVLFLTDDQDLLLDGMMPMQSTIKRVANAGLTFTNAYVHAPICCPSRSSLLTGKYLHNLRVFNNSMSGNCCSAHWREAHEGNTIAAHLKSKGNYVNFYAGKYLNQYGYGDASLSRIPPGYDHWYGLKGNSKYYNFTLSINGSAVAFQEEYLTDLMGTFALEFLRNTAPYRPFFMTLATPAPHAPFTPAKRHLDKFPAVRAKITPSFNASAENKHWLLQLPPKHLPTNADILDAIQRQRMQTLLSVDELVDSVVQRLAELNVLDDTYVLFTSDNGYHIGQFAQPWDKRQPYETDVRVPFLMRGPAIPRKRVFEHAVSLVDLAPTILTLAGVPVPDDMDGSSFAHLLSASRQSASKSARNNGMGQCSVFIEYYGEGNARSVQRECNFTDADAHNLSECSRRNWCKCQDARNNSYSCIVRFDGGGGNSGGVFKYCLFVDDFVEVYDLTVDPFELRNLSGLLDANALERVRTLLSAQKKCRGTFCRTLRNHSTL